MPLEPTRGPLLFDKDHYLVCFKAIAQGDHLGVEIATCAHGRLLEEGGLLGETSRICSNMPFKGCREAQGLVIDDYFSVCVHDLDDPREPLCSRRLSQAKSIYRSEGLAGSDDKDIVAREKLLADFALWLSGLDVGFDRLLVDSLSGAHLLNKYLVQYGRRLFEAGWPYSHYSEVINAIAAQEPLLRRSLQPAWDLAFAWMREEPHTNHVAMPWQLLLAAIATALIWGWPRVAGILALTWGGVLRIGEALAAKRADLLLPAHVSDTCDYALLSVGEPKTRYKAARHQAAKIDQPDLLKVISLAFGNLGFSQKLWPQSSSTLRSRFNMLMQRLETSELPFDRSRKIDLGSLRAGGATWLLMVSEDAELVRRRGRWLNHRTMEIYVQEVSSLQFVHRLPFHVQEKLFTLVRSFQDVLSKAEQLVLIRTPSVAWYAQYSVG